MENKPDPQATGTPPEAAPNLPPSAIRKIKARNRRRTRGAFGKPRRGHGKAAS